MVLSFPSLSQVPSIYLLGWARAHTHTHTHACTHACTHTHTHTHTHTRNLCELHTGSTDWITQIIAIYGKSCTIYNYDGILPSMVQTSYPQLNNWIIWRTTELPIWIQRWLLEISDWLSDWLTTDKLQNEYNTDCLNYWLADCLKNWLTTVGRIRTSWLTWLTD